MQIIIPRDSRDEHTFAIVQCTPLRPMLADAVCRAVVRAVTSWVTETEEGMTLWQDTAHDLNIGDLVSYIGRTPSLASRLYNAGVIIDSVEVMVGDAHDWTFDTILVDEGE